MTIERFSFPTTIHFGPGARKLVAEHLRGQGMRRPLLVTDRGIAGLPLLSAFRAQLAGLDVGVFSDIWGNPVRSQVMQGAAAYKDHRADAVIGLGGGAALDVAKAIALMAEHPGDILEYAWDHPQVRPDRARAAVASSRCRPPPARDPRSDARVSCPTTRRT